MELQRAYPQIRALGARLVAVSTNSVSTSTSLAHHLRLTFPILSDASGALGSAFGIFTPSMDMEAHAVFVIGPHGTVRWYKISHRAMHVSIASVLHALHALHP